MTWSGFYSTYGGGSNFPADISEITDRYVTHKTLGTGGFGQVSSVYDKWLETEVAFKVSNNVHSIKIEVDRLRALSPQYFIRTFDYAQTQGYAWYSMEYLQKSDGWYCLTDFSDAMQAERAGHLERGVFAGFIAKEISYGLQELHSNPIQRRSFFHGDIKPDNIFFNLPAIKRWREQSSGRQGPYIKIIDLGVSGESGSGSPGYTPRYAAPEQLEERDCDSKVDAHAVSFLLMHVLTDGKYDSATTPRTESQILRAINLAAPTRFAQEFARIAASGLTVEPTRRASCDTLAEDFDFFFDRETLPDYWRLVRHIESRSGGGEIARADLIDFLQERIIVRRGGVRRGRVSREEATELVMDAINYGVIRVSRRGFIQLI